ncbi:phenylalanine--tRNA ligase subunit alpha, partial [Thioclava sp. BHET1]
MDALTELKTKYLTAVAGASDEAGLEELRLSALGKKGEISLRMRELGKMSPEERQLAGP